MTKQVNYARLFVTASDELVAAVCTDEDTLKWSYITVNYRYPSDDHQVEHESVNPSTWCGSAQVIYELSPQQIETLIETIKEVLG